MAAGDSEVGILLSSMSADALGPTPYFLPPLREFLEGSADRPDGVCRFEPECLSSNSEYGLVAQPKIYFKDHHKYIKDIDFKGAHCDKSFSAFSVVILLYYASYFTY